GGVPYLIVELSRALLRESANTADAQPRQLATERLDDIDLPLCDWLAVQQLDRMPPALAAHAQLVAALGPEIRVAELDSILRMLDHEEAATSFPLDGQRGLEQLAELEMVELDDSGVARFRHALLREAVARSLSVHLRQTIHDAAWRYYQRQGDES